MSPESGDYLGDLLLETVLLEAGSALFEMNAYLMALCRGKELAVDEEIGALESVPAVLTHISLQPMVSPP